MVGNIKEGDTAYWKHTEEFGIVCRVAVNLENIDINVLWNGKTYSNEAYTYHKEDLAKDGQLVIGKLTKLFYAKV